MLKNDPIVLKYPQYLPTEDEVDAALRLLNQPQHKALQASLTSSIAIAGCERSSMRRFCWQARQDGKLGQACAEGAIEWLSFCVEARAKLRSDTLLHNGPFPLSFREMYLAAVPFSFHKTDKQGHPVLILRYGSIELEAFRRLWTAGEALQNSSGLAVNAAVLFHIRAMEYATKIVMARESRRQGTVVDRILAIMDVGGLGMKHVNSPLKPFLAAVSKESTPLFPETLHATVMANAPWLVAKAAWPIAKTFLHPVTQDKFIMISSAAELKAKLSEMMAPEDIPPYFGGSCGCAECLSGRLRGGSLWAWEEEEGIFSPGGKRPVADARQEQDQDRQSVSSDRTSKQRVACIPCSRLLKWGTGDSSAAKGSDDETQALLSPSTTDAGEPRQVADRAIDVGARASDSDCNNVVDRASGRRCWLAIAALVVVLVGLLVGRTYGRLPA